MSESRDPLGDRMKQQYEDITRTFLPRRTYTILRLDGRAFHQFTRTFERPFDADFAFEMDVLAENLCAQVAGTVFAFTQSDEVSLLMQDFESINTQPWFGGNIQKMVSVAASYAGAVFGGNVIDRSDAHFDARVFTIPDQVEVANYFIWRQRDATRNSISMAGQAAFSHKQLHGLTTSQVQEKLFTEKGVNWNDYPPGFKQGRVTVKSFHPIDYDGRFRTYWTTEPAPRFTTEPGGFLARAIPPMPSLSPEQVDEKVVNPA